MKHAVILMATLFLPLWALTQFDRIDVEEVDNGGAVSGKTFRIYAVMQSEGDVIDAVFGEEGKPLTISSTAPFYQHPKGSGLASEVQRFDIQNDAALAYDSWVTIGLEDNYMNSLTGFLIDLTEFEAGNALTTSNGAWFVTPDKRQALAPEDKRILLGQFTTSGVVTGVLNIHGRTKAVLDLEGNVESGAQLIQAENIRFTCGK
jgi:hypothetical protein